jgi:bacterioferritin (cytochrome b1)
MESVITSAINREWIKAEFTKGIAAEEEMFAEAKTRSDSPPDPSLSVLYHEIAAADARHRDQVEAIATRFGHTPTKNGGGIGEALSRLKERVATLGSSPTELVGHHLAMKANAIHWYTAWASTFKAVGETASANELEAILEEENTHRNALQLALNRLVERGAREETTATAG